jgi:hypothetical protein
MVETTISSNLASSFSPAIGNVDFNEIILVVICAWCEQEGKQFILRPSTSLDHPSPAWQVHSHGICQAHRDQVLAKFFVE